MSKPITTLLFDFDGTLLDTNELILQTFEYVLEKHYSGQFNREQILPFLGPTLTETFQTIDPTRVDELSAEYREWNNQMHDELAVEFDGVSDTLRALKAEGLKMAIVSTKQSQMVRKGLKLLDVEDIFDVVIGLDHVTRAKPDPEPLLIALEKLGAKPEEALMIGDNYHDILGGKNAGVRTAGVAWSLKGEAYLQTLNPDFMLHHISDMLKIIKGVDL